MKVLMLCLRSPFPPADGGTIAMYNMAQSIVAAGAQVRILAFNTRKHHIAENDIPGWFRDKYNLSLVYLDATVKPWPAFRNLFSADSYNVSRFDVPEFHAAIIESLTRENFDVIQLESLFMTPYIDTIRKHTQASIVLRAHNVEFIIWQRMAGATNNPLKKKYLQFLSSRLREYEKATINKLDALVTLTGEDETTFRNLGCLVPLFVSPIGIDTGKYSAGNDQSSAHAIAHLGSMDWMPNIEGVEWFLEEIYPGLLASGVDCTIHIAGKSMPDRFFRMAGEKLKVYGRIDQPNDFFSDKQIMIVPLLSGGGMRVKIIEGLALSKTIIATSIGAEGIRYTNGENIIIADTPLEFTNAILRCLGDSPYCMRIGHAARRLAESEYENGVVGKRLLDFYQNGLGAGSHGTQVTSSLMPKS